MSYLRHTFFLNLFKLLSADKCVQISEFGEPIEINIGYPTSLSSDLVFGYKLTAIEEQEVHDKSRTSFDQNTEDKTNFVLVNKGISSVTFEVRFTKTGQYKLQIFGGRHSEFGDKPPWILDLKLICQSVQADNVQLPVDPGPSGWGPGAATLELGLYVPSHFEGVIYVSENEPEHVYFILAEPSDVIVELLHGEIESQNINQHVKCNIELQNDILVLHTVLSFPGDGEYVLRMEVKRGKVIRNACNYVVRTRKERPHEASNLF
ncbi:hypothetical protein DPMN_110922 [Dreissena polymorpha]|uniref:KY-like immunoglobulin-like domain-containing protein n=1 Tax=Dreissena polymorpha TaxID=45954 RepID=A0A9D4KCW5_DREPO|nr:hypothetical protein DPMN_110919 [Dreissena polymorpha]KAH3837530.1 hypothetical protein DPMN_110922 [Dreissena polymorpha]